MNNQPPPFEPEHFQIVRDPRQIKAFTDPLRIRVLRVLREREATNQQIARLLEQPQARVLHHVRSLLDVELIRLVRQEVSGGNVEKYYRATARMYGLRPGEERDVPLAGSVFASVAQDLDAAHARWPSEPPAFELRSTRIGPERRAEFEARLEALTEEFWGSPTRPATEDPGAPLQMLATVIYRVPSDIEDV